MEPVKTNILVTQDNIEYLKSLPDECIDFVVTSPPYDDLRDYKGFSLDINGVGEQLLRVIKPGGVVVWVVQDACVKKTRSGTSFRTVVDWMNMGWKLWDTLLYFRRGVWAHKTRFRVDHEYMFVFSKGNELQYFNKEHLDVVNPSAGKTYTGGCTRLKDGTTADSSTWVARPTKCRGTIFNYNFGGDGTKLKHEHPASFPNLLALDMIELFCPPGGIVLDPFSGSGTTVLAARDSGREYIGVDISEVYNEIARKRLEQENIFRPEVKLPDYVTEQANLDKFFEEG